MATAPSITVHVPASLLAWCKGEPEVSVPASSVRGLLDELERSHPHLHRGICDETGKVRRHVNLFVNGAHVRERGGLDTPLVAGDAVTILPAVSGG